MGDLFQPLLIQHLHPAAVEADEALPGEILQQTADDLAGGTHIAGDLVVGHVEIGPAGLGQLVRQEDGQPPVGAHEEDLLHRPHGVGKAFGGHLVGVAADIDILLHQLAEDARADAVGLGVLLGVDVKVKVDRVHDAGG